MEKELGQNDLNISKYFDELLKPEDELLKKVRLMCEQEGLPMIQVAKYDARHLEVIVSSLKPTVAVEIGTLGGYSGISILRGLPKTGRLLTFELSAKHAEIAKKSFELAGFSDRVQIFVGPALENLSKLENEEVDLVFIDADKQNYCNYFQWAKKVLKVGGVILADNTFAWGNVWDQSTEDQTVKSLQRYNEMAAKDPSFKTTIIPTNEGLTMSVRIK